MKNLKKLSRNELKNVGGGAFGMDGTLEPVKACTKCPSGVTSCYTDPDGDYNKALKMAKSLC